jgi:hypothetical protein
MSHTVNKMPLVNLRSAVVIDFPLAIESSFDPLTYGKISVSIVHISHFTLAICKITFDDVTFVINQATWAFASSLWIQIAINSILFIDYANASRRNIEIVDAITIFFLNGSIHINIIVLD